LDVRLCFAPLMRWLMSWWQGKELALAIDATLHGDRISALVISVLYRGSAIPVAWHMLPANRQGAWIAPVLELLARLGSAVPKDMTVLVMTDRGLWSPRLWKQIRKLGYHPVMRVRTDLIFQPAGGALAPALRLVSGPGHAWVGVGTAFSTTRLKRFGTLIVMWDKGQKEPWLVLSDLDPGQVGVCWYGLRFWIELGFRAMKGVGWQWQHTRRTDPERASRHWLVLAVASLWVMAYGTRVEDALAKGVDPCRLRTPPVACASHNRIISVFRQGRIWMQRLLHTGRLWKRLWLMPEPWPQPSPSLQITHHYAPPSGAIT
jgi:hypothetical protein